MKPKKTSQPVQPVVRSEPIKPKRTPKPVAAPTPASDGDLKKQSAKQLRELVKELGINCFYLKFIFLVFLFKGREIFLGVIFPKISKRNVSRNFASPSQKKRVFDFELLDCCNLYC